MIMTAEADSERFQSGANKYAVYLETPEGRLRTDLAFANLQDFLPPQPKPSLCALDLGGGTGATAIRLAQLGIHVTLLDSSPAMLDIAKRAAREAGVTDKVLLQHGDATELANLFRTRSFDVILCHNFLEYSTIRALCCALRLAPCGIHPRYCPFSCVTRQVKCSRQLSRREIWLRRKMASLPSGDKKPFTEAGCDYSPRIACDPCCQRLRWRRLPCEAYASLRTIYRRGFLAALTTNGFLSWSGNWLAGQSMRQSPATLTAWHVA